MDRRPLALVLLLSLLLVGNPVYMPTEAFDPAYIYSVEPLDETSLSTEDAMGAYSYQSLSPEAQHAFDIAFTDADGQGTLYGDENRVAAFTYSDHEGHHPGTYVIEKQNENYVLYTYYSTGRITYEFLVQQLFWMLGLVVGATAVLGAYTESKRTATLVATAALVTFLVGLVGIYATDDTILQFALLVGIVVSVWSSYRCIRALVGALLVSIRSREGGSLLRRR